VLELGHTSEQGANDNATGVAAMLEAVAALNRLVEGGKLPRPRRSIRILAMGELYLTLHYIATHRERIRATVAAINLDAAAGPYALAGTEYTFRVNPDIARSYIDALIARVAEAYFPHLTPPRAYHVDRYGTGSDEFLPDPSIGIPTVRALSRTGVHTHHNSEDTLERVDPRSLRDLSIVTAAFLYTIANADEADAPWLAEIAADRGYEQVLHAAGAFLERAFAAASGRDLSQTLQAGLEQIDYTVDRESQAVQSVLRLVPEQQRSGVTRQLTAIQDNLRRFGRDQSDRLRHAVDQRAQALGTGSIQPAPPPRDQQWAAASRVVVKRKRFGTLPLDDLPVAQWEGYPYASWDLAPVTALYWCDGERNLAEVIRLTRMEHDVAGFDFLGYFRFLARHGYVELTGDGR
jgi:hypothetical protein